MPGENLKVVQAAFEAYFRGDEPAMLERMDSDIIVTQFPEQPDVRPYHGHEGMDQAIAEWTDTWDDYSIEVIDMREVGGHVLVSLHQRGRGKGSGIDVQGQTYFVLTVRSGKVVRWQMFSSEEQAMEAAATAGR
jgi:ketosteroid isomerase-like protein